MKCIIQQFYNAFLLKIFHLNGLKNDIHTSSRSSSKPYRSLIENLKWHIEHFVFDTLTTHTHTAFLYIIRCLALKYLLLGKYAISNFSSFVSKTGDSCIWRNWNALNVINMLASMKPEHIVIVPKNISFGCCIVNSCLHKTSILLYIFSSTHFTNKQQHFTCHTVSSIPDFNFKYERTYSKFIEWKQTETITVNCWKQIKINCNILIAFMAILTH